MLEKFHDIVRRYSANKEINLKDDVLLLTDLGLNSLEIMKLISELEESFSVEIPDRVLIEFKTTQDILDYLNQCA